jgi:acyl carrier protein
VNSVDDFIGIVRDELGLPVTARDLTVDLAEVPGWDSVLLLRLLVVLERTTGSTLSLPDLLQASNLERIYALAVGT